MNNVQGYQESVLLVFGGMVSEVNPYDVPAGSSPVATDVDFTVQSVRTRDGLANVYSYEGYFEEMLPGIGDQISTAADEVAWSDPSNIELGSPGTYASVSLNVPASGSGIWALDKQITQVQSIPLTDFQGTVTTGPLTPESLNEVPIALVVGNLYHGSVNQLGPVDPATQLFSDTFPYYSGLAYTSLPLVSPISIGVNLEWGSGGETGPMNVVSVLALFTLTGIFEAGVPEGTAQDASSADTVSYTYGSGVTSDGETLIALVYSPEASVAAPGVTVTDDAGNVYQQVGMSFSPGGTGNYACWCAMFVAPVTKPALSTTFTATTTSTQPLLVAYGGVLAGIGDVAATGGLSEVLRGYAYGFSIPGTSEITKVEVEVSGYQTNSAADSILTLGVLGAPNPGGFPLTTLQLPASEGNVTLDVSTAISQQAWTPAIVNNPAFGFSLQASASQNASFFVDAIRVTVWYTPPDIGNFNYVKTLAFTDGETLTLALDDSGVFWQENIESGPNVLTPFFTAIEPNSFARSVTLDDREFIALSDLAMGTDMPRQYNGQWVDRISQVGPAAAPSVTFNTTAYDIVSITQAPAVDFGGNDYTFVWSANAGTSASGNTISIQAHTGLLADVIAAGVGATIVLAGIPLTGGQDPNGTYIITAVGTVPTARYGPNSPYFSVAATISNKVDGQINSGSYQLTTATLTTEGTIPNLQVNGQLTIAGASLSGYDGTWTVTATPNASQMSIVDTSLSGNVAQYVFDLITGTAPIVGQQVTVTGTTNGNGIFNVANATVTAVSTIGNPVTGGTFSVAIVSADISGAAEEGNAIVNGTIFEFDPGAIIGDATEEGTVVVAGGLGAGVRGCCYMFLTRNGFLTAPSPQTIFTLDADASSITVSNLLTGPPDVIARVVAFTGAGGATQSGGGGFYFWIPSPVTVIDEGQNVVYSATIVNDNSTTQQTFTFTDAVLLAAESITDQGNNNFAQIELGSCLGVIAYSSRLFAWGEQTKLDNLLNYSFDGGIGQAIGSTIQTYPAGWTIDPTNGAGGSVSTSPIFGNAYLITNASGSTQAVYGMITQGAYHDVIGGAPIIASATTYSIRVTASTPSGSSSGNLVVDLYSPSTTQQWGSFTIPLSSMTENMAIFTGTLLTTAFQTVPADLLIRLYATSLPDGATILVDRIEPFPTMQPVLSTQLRASYFDNFEAFDQITGNLGVGTQNQQPVTNAFTLFDNLYVVKTKSMDSTTDNGVTEPNGWTVREVSNKVGTPSIYGVDVGEGWALVAGQAGLYLFEGGEPMKINPELDGDPGLWQSINWTYGNTLWLRNDTDKRKIYIGVPIATPNQFMPKFPANANPTQPNVVLVCNYKELMTSGALSSEGPIRQTFMGDLKTFALGRKWAAWSIEACYADFITRPDTTDQLFFCGDTETGKIYAQISGNYADDGQAMHCQYTTSPMPKSQEAQQTGMGLFELEAVYMGLLVQGSGDLKMTIIPNSLDSADAEALYPLELHDPPLHDSEVPLNQIGTRFFMEFSVGDPGDWFELSRLVMAIGPSPWAVVRGTNE